jgi:hypothetical protein
LNRIHGLIRRSGWTLLIVMPHSIAHGSNRYAAVEMTVRHEAWLYDKHHTEWVVGYRALITVTHLINSPAGQTVNLSFMVKEQSFDYMFDYS